MGKAPKKGKKVNYYTDSIRTKNKDRKQKRHEKRLEYFAKRLEKRLKAITLSQLGRFNDCLNGEGQTAKRIDRVPNKRSAIKLLNAFLKKKKK